MAKDNNFPPILKISQWSPKNKAKESKALGPIRIVHSDSTVSVSSALEITSPTDRKPVVSNNPLPHNVRFVTANPKPYSSSTTPPYEESDEDQVAETPLLCCRLFALLATCFEHAEDQDGWMHANCTCTVVKSPKNTVVVDTMTPWDGPFILSKLKEIGVSQIDYVISSHGHSDHTGNNNLFIENVKQHIVGYCISCKDQYYAHPFEQDEDYVLDEWMKVVPTPGHTSEDVTLLAETKDGITVAVAGDLFECGDDLQDPNKWIANSFNPEKQASSRLKILKVAKSIIPGHGAQFDVLPEHIEAAQKMVDKYSSCSS